MLTLKTGSSLNSSLTTQNIPQPRFSTTVTPNSLELARIGEATTPSPSIKSKKNLEILEIPACVVAVSTFQFVRDELRLPRLKYSLTFLSSDS